MYSSGRLYKKRECQIKINQSKIYSIKNYLKKYIFFIDGSLNFGILIVNYLLFIFFILPHLVIAQYDHLAFRHLTIDDGLSNNSVWTIFKDNQGFMWFGTVDGLNRFDGYSFTVFKNDPKSENTLSNNTIVAMHEDKKGRIWIGTRGGLNLFDRETESFFTFKDTIDEVNLSQIYVSDIREDSKGNVWITGSPAFFKFNLEEGEMISYQPDPNDPFAIAQNRTAGIYIEGNDKIWIGHDGKGISEFSIADQKFINHRFEDTTLDGTLVLEYNAIREIMPYGDEKLLLGTFGGLLSFDKKTGSFRRIVIDGHQFRAISSLVPDKNTDQIWISTSGWGLYLLDINSGQLQNWSFSKENLLGLSEKSLASLLLDDQDLLWVGTSRSGIDILDTRNPFQLYQSSNSWLSSNLISCIYEDSNGSVWVGSSGNGLSVLNNKEQHDRYINSELGRFISNVYITCIEEDNDQNLWIGTSGNGLFKYDPKSGKYKLFLMDRSDKSSLRHNVIYCIEKIHNGQLLIGTYLGYCLMDPVTEKFQYGAPGIARTILAEKPGVAWFGYDLYGLFYLNLLKNEKMQFLHEPGDSLSISSNTIETIYMDRDSVLWIGTNNGLNRYNRENQNFIIYTMHDGLCHNSIMGILEDDAGNLWISTNRGLSKFDKKTSTFSNYYSEDGLQSNQFSREACFKGKNGTLYFGGINGLTVFDPAKVVPRKKVPEVAITGFYLYNKPVPLQSEPRGDYGYKFLLEKPIYLTESIHLKYFEKIFSFDFTALDYVNPEKNQYAFTLEGFEDQWNYTTSDKRFATYTNLDPGTYSFKMKATNSDGIWNETPTVLSIRVDPPPWATWWAFTLYVLFFIGAIWGFIAWRTREQKRKLLEVEKVNTRLRQVDQLKDQFLANTSHELRTPLQGIIGLSESLYEQEKNKKKRYELAMITSSGKRLSSLVNSILDFSKLKTHELTLSLKPLDFRTLIDVVINISQPLIKGKTVRLVNEVDPSIPLILADEDRLYQVMHNLIGNAIKFTNEGHITISAGEKKDVVLISVEDTGIGIPEDKLDDIFKSFEQVDASITREHGGTGLGLTITRQLIELQGGNIWVESEVDKGTTIYFTLPKSTDKRSTISEQPVLSKVSEALPVEKDVSFEILEEKLPSDLNNKFIILIVDDESINQQVLANHLSNYNFRILHAMNGKEALDLLEKEHLDLVLLDIMMPKMSGYEVCREIRKKYLPSELPVIMITAKDQVTDLVEGLASGANDYLSKPFSRDELLARLKTHLNLYKINAAYLRFIPKEFIAALGHESIIDVKLGDQAEGEMTILFSDIRSFTTLTERLDARKSFELLNSYLKYVTPAITANGGFIDKYIGDAVMALFPFKPEDAVKAAIEAQKNLDEFNRIRKEDGSSDIRIGIGIHTGPLMIGTIGVEKRMDGTVISDAVNLASRLEELNKHYGTSMIISEETFIRLEDPEKYNYRFLSNVGVEGKKQANRIYEFFDGDSDHNKEMKIKTLPAFRKGIKEYYNKRFAQASVEFQEVLNIYPEDKTAKIFLEHAAKYMVQGVPDDWDGVDIVDKVF